MKLAFSAIEFRTARAGRALRILVGACVASLLLTSGFGCATNTLPIPVVLPSDVQPAWSPDGKQIAYTHRAQSATDTLHSGLYVLDLATRSRRLVADTPPTSLAWFGDSRRIAIAAGRILEVSVETGVMSELFPHDAYYPHVSPGDTTLAFDTWYQDPRDGSVIWLRNFATGELRDISTHGTGEWRQPRWSPDGRWILHFRYAPSSNGTPELFKMDPTGKTAVRLTNNSVFDIDGCWSPDGTLIAWTHGNRYAEIWVMAADGTNARFLHRGREPCFSPDGRQIVFVDPDVAAASLRLINVDGTGYFPL